MEDARARFEFSFRYYVYVWIIRVDEHFRLMQSGILICLDDQKFDFDIAIRVEFP
jgi:hypothetical protein